MKDYSKLGDWEVNQKIAKLLYPDHNVMCYPHDADGKSVGVELHKGGNLEWFDYCNTVKDSWPIITGNNIAVIPYRHTLPCAWPTAFGVTSKFTTEDKNPLRAAMIVFLMLHDAGQDKPQGGQ